MINEVRNAVMSVINKNNYGYISPSDFNLFAEQAQLDIFEDYFYLYNNQLNSEVARASGSGYADLTKGLIEVIDSFSVNIFLTRVGNANTYNLPEDYYLIDKIFYYSNVLDSGTASGTAAFELIEAGQDFLTTVSAGNLVVNTTISRQAYVVSVDSDTTLTLSNDIIVAGQSYIIYSNTHIREVERVTQNKIFYLTNSNLTAPTTTFPAYVLNSANASTIGNSITVYPSTITGVADIQSQYVRYPLAPKWTYEPTMVNGEPLFKETATDYQDFELPSADMNGLVNKILEYSGVSIREKEVTKFGQQLEAEDRLTENPPTIRK
tara:strand:- start:536 stop:1501 length:966 start_codon:yes stop_codon:yes gene_type:complete